MSQCINPDCLKENLENSQQCSYCGKNLLIKNRYRAIKILGEGGFGRTFKAIDESSSSQTYCVIKQFIYKAQGKEDINKAAQLFAQEAERLQELGQHEQIPELLDYFSEDKDLYLIQEYIEGPNLTQELRKNGSFNEEQVRDLLVQLLSVLGFIHSKNIIHRDLKPDNIIINSENGKLFLIDFGASKALDRNNVEDDDILATLIGSADYTSPEQARGKPTYASDLYSLGVTCIQMLTNVRPSLLIDPHEMSWRWKKYVKIKLSEEITEILDKLIEGGINYRYKSVNEVLERLNSTLILNKSEVSTKKNIPKNIGNDDKGLQNKQVLNKNIKTKNRSRNSLISELKPFEFEVVTINRIDNFLGLLGWKKVKTEQKLTKVKYFTANIGNGVTIDFISIPGGKFFMGSPPEEEGHLNSESPQHWVKIKPFYLSKYIITQAQWQVVMKNNPSYYTGLNRPVENVSWYDAMEFCEKLSKIIQRKGTSSKKFRLPSEAEWEYACRGNTETTFHFGDYITTEFANYNCEYTYSDEPRGTCRKQTSEVGSFPPNAFGLCDLHGNVWEWCADVWHNSYENAPNDGTVRNEEIENNSIPRVVRGGSWNDHPWLCRSASRLCYGPEDRFNNLGFRVAISIE